MGLQAQADRSDAGSSPWVGLRNSQLLAEYGQSSSDRSRPVVTTRKTCSMHWYLQLFKKGTVPLFGIVQHFVVREYFDVAVQLSVELKVP